uniref:BHLH domain-containing protein n=1 Tax=Timema bartmani TaxID=61472 RepID=A0A7R9ESI3_9NEOP|nr:unnamed protein product [Timema bartmani]
MVNQPEQRWLMTSYKPSSPASVAAGAGKRMRAPLIITEHVVIKIPPPPQRGGQSRPFPSPPASRAFRGQLTRYHRRLLACAVPLLTELACSTRQTNGRNKPIKHACEIFCEVSKMVSSKFFYHRHRPSLKEVRMTNPEQDHLTFLPSCMFADKPHSRGLPEEPYTVDSPPSGFWKEHHDAHRGEWGDQLTSCKVVVVGDRVGSPSSSSWEGKRIVVAATTPLLSAEECGGGSMSTSDWSDDVFLRGGDKRDREPQVAVKTKRSSAMAQCRDKGGRGNRRPPAPYKHVPHRDKPPQFVARRNARERRRVQAVNTAFVRLRKVVPVDNNRGKRVSKVKTLRRAIEYIGQLQKLLLQDNPELTSAMALDLNKENMRRSNTRWGAVDSISRLNGHQPESLAQLLEEFSEEF